jgi:hypothetical protein
VNPVTLRSTNLSPDERAFLIAIRDAKAAGQQELVINGSVLVYCPGKGCETFRSSVHRHAARDYPGKRDPNIRVNPVTGDEQHRRNYVPNRKGALSGQVPAA